MACSRRSRPYRTSRRALRLPGTPTFSASASSLSRATTASSRSGGGTRAPLGRRSRHVDHELAAARADHDDLRLLDPVVPLAVDLAGGQVDAIPLTRVKLRLAAGSAFDVHLTGDDVDHRFVRAVVMPARRAAGFGPYDS